MQCDCELSPDGKSFVNLCEDHYSLKIVAMTRERDCCKKRIQWLLDAWVPDDGEYGNGLLDAIGEIEGLSESDWELDNNSLVQTSA